MALVYDQIGGLSFLKLEGDIDPQQLEMTEITRRGTDGRAYKAMGNRGEPFKLRGIVDVASASAANTLMTTYKALVGTIVTIRKETQSRTNYLVLDVRIRDRRPVFTAVGGITAGTYLVTSEWTLVYAST